MKKILLIAALMAVAFASCKKEDKNNPTPQDPVVNDSLDMKLRVYATKHQMEYLNYQVYITFAGETKERKIDMTNPVQLDKNYDQTLLSILDDKISSDSVLVYTLNTRVKKGNASYRFEYSKADSMPEAIDIILGIRFSPLEAVSGESITYHKGVETNSIDQFMDIITKSYPINVILK